MNQNRLEEPSAETAVNLSAADLGVVQETLLTPLYGRSRQFDRDDAIVRDPVARRMVNELDYDFAKLDRFGDTLVGTAIRASVFDNWIQHFLSQDDRDPTIVLIGEGLDTTFDRNDRGRGQWFELDFPDVIDLRKRCFPRHERRHALAADVLTGQWIERVRASGGERFLFQIAGVLMYLPPEAVRSLMVMLAENFPGSVVLFDTCSTLALRHSDRWEATVRTTKAKYQWGIDDPRDIADWDPRLRVTDVVQQLDRHRHQWSLKTRFWSTVWRRLRHSYPCCRCQIG